MRNKNQRFSSQELLLIRKLTAEGKSLNFLSQLMGVGKPTLYYQVRKFKPRIKKDFIVNLNESQIGELIGAFAGDGSYTYCLNTKKDLSRGGQHRIRYHLSLKDDINYAEYLKNLLTKLNLNPHLFIRESENSITVAVSSLPYINFIKKYLEWSRDKTYSVRLRNQINDYSSEFLKGFARGLMDTDGFLNPANAVCACISEKLIDNLSSIFIKFEIEFTRTSLKRGSNRRELFYIRVRRKSLGKYEELIGFSNDYKRKKIKSILEKDLKEH